MEECHAADFYVGICNILLDASIVRHRLFRQRQLRTQASSWDVSVCVTRNKNTVQMKLSECSIGIAQKLSEEFVSYGNLAHLFQKIGNCQILIEEKSWHSCQTIRLKHHGKSIKMDKSVHKWVSGKDTFETNVTVEASFPQQSQTENVVLALRKIFARSVFFNFDIQLAFTFEGDDSHLPTLIGPVTQQLRSTSFIHTVFINDRTWMTILLGTQHAFRNERGELPSLPAGELHLQFYLNSFALPASRVCRLPNSVPNCSAWSDFKIRVQAEEPNLKMAEANFSFVLKMKTVDESPFDRLSIDVNLCTTEDKYTAATLTYNDFFPRCLREVLEKFRVKQMPAANARCEVARCTDGTRVSACPNSVSEKSWTFTATDSNGELINSCVQEMLDGFEHHQHRCIIASYELLRSPALQVQTAKTKRKKINLRHVDVACGALVELVHMMSFQSQDRANRILGSSISLKQLQSIARTCSGDELNLDLTRLPLSETFAEDTVTQTDSVPRAVQDHFEIICA